MRQRLYGLNGRVLRVDLSTGRIWQETPEEALLHKYVGGTSLGVRYLYDLVKPGTRWSAPDNIFFVGSGPLGGTSVGGSGGISVVTVGALTGGATSTQANGYLGAYLKFSGYDAIILEGAAPDWQYLFVHDGVAELRDARHLAGKDTWEIEDIIKGELGYTLRGMSVFGIGPAGENGVRFAALVGDRGHVASHNGVGAVLGAKRLKAIAVARGRGRVEVKDPERLGKVSQELWEGCRKGGFYEWGTSRVYSSAAVGGWLPVKNYTTNLFPEHPSFMGDIYRKRFQMHRHPCWACQMRHCHILKVTDGPYAGYEGEEPEYEQWAAWGAQIGQTELGAAVVLSNEVDRLGMDTNEAGWVVGWVMECYERGLLNREDLDGLEMRWGNAEAARALLGNIAQRRGFGDLLADGVMRAARRIGGEAAACAIYTAKGNSPRGHDHRGRWSELLDTCVSNTGTIETHIGSVPRLEEYGLPAKVEDFSPEQVATAVAKTKGSMQFEDSLVTCRFTSRTEIPLLCQAVEAATGWDISFEEALAVGRRAVNLMRLFNLRQGITPEVERPSARYASTPVDGPVQGKGIGPHWETMLRIYYEQMGWDRRTGAPLPETLRQLGLEEETTNQPR